MITSESLLKPEEGSVTAGRNAGNPGVFICHRKADAELAEGLAEDVRRAGYRVWLDEWEIGIGDSIVERINAGLEDLKYLIVCYCEAGVLSPWMSREWMSTLTRQLEGYGIRVLPARLSGGVPPAILADIRYADLAANWEDGLKDLLKAMR
jgi:hypothetical protein